MDRVALTLLRHFKSQTVRLDAERAIAIEAKSSPAQIIEADHGARDITAVPQFIDSLKGGDAHA